MSDLIADTEAEQLLIAAVLAGMDLDPLAQVVSAEDFYQPRHESIWRAFLRIREAGNAVDIASVRVALDHDGAKVDPVYLAELYGRASLTADGTWHAARVADLAALRRLAGAATKIQQATHSSADLNTARSLARQALDDALGDERTHALVRLADVVPDVLDIAERGQSPALSTPWPDVDRIITGLAPGRFVVVGARPGGAKSIMGTNLALHFASHHGHAALIASMEMPREEVTQRLIAAKARVSLTSLTKGEMAEPQWDNIRRHHTDIMEMPIFIDDSPQQSVAHILATAKQTQRERDDLALIVVDYIQLMATPGAHRNSTRTERLGEVTQGLKRMARETGACVVAMAQVNREGVKGGARPTMGDLRESGSIEADADQVILLHRPDDELPTIDVLVDKNRWGPKGVAHLDLQGHYARLASTARQSWVPESA